MSCFEIFFTDHYSFLYWFALFAKNSIHVHITCIIQLFIIIDPCDTTNFINDWRRSVAVTNDHQLCDNILKEDWYRVLSGSGTKMPTVCPVSFFACGTTGHIWLSNGKCKNNRIFCIFKKTKQNKTNS